MEYLVLKSLLVLYLSFIPMHLLMIRLSVRETKVFYILGREVKVYMSVAYVAISL